MGLQKVLYPWLVVGVLNESSKLGLAQLAVLLLVYCLYYPVAWFQTADTAVHGYPCCIFYTYYLLGY